MPITTRQPPRTTSPLGADGQHRRMATMSDSPQTSKEQSGWEIVPEIGSAILTSRSCDRQVVSCDLKQNGVRPRSVQDCEIFQPISSQSLEVMKNEMDHLWKQGIPICIEVKGQTTPTNSYSSPSLLLEQWLIQVAPKRPQCSAIQVSFLLQAVLSFLHFSQVRSWVVAWSEQISLQLLYRVCAPGEDGEQFTVTPETHNFPPTHLSPHHTLLISVQTFPRQSAPPLLLFLHPRTSTSGCALATSSCNHRDQPNIGEACPVESQRTPREYLDKVDKLTEQVSNMATGECVRSHRDQYGCIDNGVKKVSSFFPVPDPRPLSPKLLSGLGDLYPHMPHSKIASTLTNTGCKHCNQFCLDQSCLEDSMDPKQPTVKGQHPSKGTPVLINTNEKKVLPPSASSPMPDFRLRSRSSDQSVSGMSKRRSCAISMKGPSRPHPPVRSNSCPAIVPSLCLLGTFEESVLNGRLEPCGSVDGFSAELGASGAFCPPHISLPVGAAYFSVHAEHGGGSSPYLGHIDLSGVGKKGYRVPKKGTIQLTLFNPNQTVVKIYIVRYDLSDMPPHTQTFLRQKTLSNPDQGAGSIPALHYLIHLRFHCSKSDHTYLHKDIKIIFARRAPDTTDFDLSRVNVYTIVEGPTRPKYCPKYKPSAGGVCKLTD